MTRLTLICPEALMDDANALAATLGEGPQDAASFGNPVWVDAGGARFAAISLVSDDLLDAVSAPLGAPDWPVDLVAAERARARIERVGDGEGAGEPAALRLFVGISAPLALSRAGLQAEVEATG